MTAAGGVPDSGWGWLGLTNTSQFLSLGPGVAILRTRCTSVTEMCPGGVPEGRKHRFP